MLPWLKRKEEGSASSPVESVERKPDEAKEFGMLDAVADDMLAAFKADDHSALVAALESLVAHIQEQDKKQDGEQS
jgi:hypothetical protein